MIAQPIYKTGARSATTARSLNAARSVAPHVLSATIYDERFIGREVVYCTAHETTVPAGIPIAAGEHFFLVASKFVGRFYIVTRRDGAWVCSSDDGAVAAWCIAQVKAYQAARKAAA